MWLRIGIGVCLAALLIVACGGGGNALPTRVPVEKASPANDTPRDALPSPPTPDSSLPPTWTPPPPPSPPPTDPPPTDPPPQPTLQTYVIQPGDTLAEIATRFGVTLAELSRLNNIADVDRIEVGDVLIIPTP